MAAGDRTAPQILERADFGLLIQRLAAGGRTVLGPVLRDGAIVYGEVTSDADLPAGWTDDQAAGRYAVARRADAAVFGYAVGPQSWKRYLHPPRRTLWRAKRTEDSFVVEQDDTVPKRAFLGVRACELAAIRELDKVLREGTYPDPAYTAARENALIVVVNCGAPAKTCFCASMGTGPKAEAGYDLALTELLDAGGHRFLIEAETEAGRTILADLPTRMADASDLEAARAVIDSARSQMHRTLDTDGLAERLVADPEHPRWAEVADRCLSCGNCTQVCPTCFCTSVEDHSSLNGNTAERVQVWDSCFTGRFSELSGGQVRETTASRYRQWLTHKLSTWHDQFGSSGCVGCGRCIAWCPVGIDLTEEAEALSRKARP